MKIIFTWKKNTNITLPYWWILLLFSYPLIELTRYIWVWNNNHINFLTTAIFETLIMWVLWITGAIVIKKVMKKC